MIDSQIGEYDFVYLQCANPYFDDEKDLVQVDVSQSVIREKEVDGVIKSYFHKIKGYKAYFKRLTWDNQFGGVSKTSYDTLFISTIALVNDRELNNTWTGQELQRISYWAKPMTFNGETLGGITASDLEIVTPEILATLNL